MNTKKALIVIMVLLILMNIALASYIIVISTSGKSDLSIDEYTKKILEQRNIELKCKIPDASPNAASIMLGDMIYNDSTIETLSSKTGGSYSLDELGRLIYIASPTDIEVVEEMNRSAVERISHAFISDIGLQLEEFELDMVLETGTDEYEVRYISKDGQGIFYYDSYVEMTVTNYGVVYSEVYIKHVKERDSKKAESLPIYTILLTNLVAESKPITIEKISYGYHQRNPQINESVMSWRVRFSDGSDRFFEVSTGLEITSILEKLKYNGIILKYWLPEPFSGNSNIVYGESSFTSQMLNTMTVFMNGDASIGENGLITYIRSSYENSVSYNLNDETITQICNEFIDSLGKNSNDYYLDTSLQQSDGIYTSTYIYKDSKGHLYFNNSIEIHFSELGVIFASFRDDVFVFGKVFSDNIFIGSILPDVLDTEGDREYVITEIQKGYKSIDGVSKQAVACWRVVFEDGSIRYFTAETGEEIMN